MPPVPVAPSANRSARVMIPSISENIQNSVLVALPLKTAYFLNASRYQVIALPFLLSLGDARLVEHTCHGSASKLIDNGNAFERIQIGLCVCRRRLENVAPGGEWRSDEKRSAQMITCSSRIRLSENPKSSEPTCCGGQGCTPIWSSGLRFAVAF